MYQDVLSPRGLGLNEEFRAMTHKRCVICSKPVGKPARGPAGVYCSKRCKALAHERRWRAANPDKKREMNRRYYLANCGQILERRRKNRAESSKTSRR